MTWALEEGRLLGAPARVLRELVATELNQCQPDMPDAPVLFADDGSAIAAVTIDRLPAAEAFHYLVDQGLLARLSIGSIVRVPFRGRSVRGWITGFPGHSDIAAGKLRPVKAVLGDMPVFNGHDLVAARVISRYYLGGLWQVLRHFQPPGLPVRTGSVEPQTSRPALRAENCLPRVDLYEVAPAEEALSSVFDLIQSCIADQRSAIVVDPVAPTLTASRLRRHGVPVIDLTACRSQTEERLAWIDAATRDGVAVVGGRSAVFQHVGNPGLFVVVDETNPSLKEQSSPCYHAREVAVVRAACLGADVALTSASPSFEARIWAADVRRPEPSARRRGWPAVEIIHRQDEPPTGGILSEGAVARARRVLEQGGRILLFLNRAGEARATRCGACLRLRTCDACGGALLPERGTRPGQDRRLACTSCQAILPITCAHCGSAKVKRLGAGTRALAREAEHLFPRNSIVTVDRESRSSVDLADVIVGTEAAFWRTGALDLVVVVDLDSLLLAPDATAVENAWRLLVRAAAHAPPRADNRPYAGMLIQTYMPEIPFSAALVDGDPEKAASEILDDRESNRLPPFVRCARVTVTGENSSTWARNIAQLARSCGAQVLGPDESGSSSRVLVLSSEPAEAWKSVALGASEARSAGRKVRIEVDPSRLE
ncbi:MAG: hypothetical protein DCC49_04155 [Acidobacteria bacterium]|nr:MAG: hypothetical protein DCC49_04155 [Acidobacteriota bacterium]